MNTIESRNPFTLQYKANITVRRAEHLGLCFGVRDAINFARSKVTEHPITVMGELVHNTSVLDDLKKRGVQFKDKPEQVETKSAMITAHGASNRVRNHAKMAGLKISDATCPLVHYAHQQIRKLADAGCHPIIIGRRGHVEVRGLTEDLAACDVILNKADIDALAVYPSYGVMAQTTQPITLVRILVDYLRNRFPSAEVRFVDTVCQPTKQRQQAAVELAKQSDVVLVVGGANSNNTYELARTCAKFCSRVHHVQGPDDIRADWLVDADKLGITAGTSTPDELIDAVERKAHTILDK
ncbi:MAG: 4-hydroxy-3-methylbut-2-enyl diphosphate reductase [Verrucomicrobiota bacterium]|jgi:4-hydroxy-3-methylbut-2-enyl diphosphate reductase|nr:4-hydroxy-3-methylbut-2-enyl diphosphate reductase [Verrucomicrobiota bacterium]|tara:strand:+ start:847 stop:1737 length:891 start_codon:yes stop_codon:yes gene_type:complete